MEWSGFIAASLMMSAVLFSRLATNDAQCDQSEQNGPLLCCKGRNSSCVVDQEQNVNRRSVCYCDEFCKSAGDCCDDFEETRRKCTSNGVKDCTVSPWTRWSSCSHRCGVGVRKRSRVIVSLGKGGKRCPALRQRRGCFKTPCGVDKGIAHILPVKFRRRSFETTRYQKILPAKKNAVEDEKPKRLTYCINYKLESKHPYCKGTWAGQLDPTRPICVECHERAMNKKGECNGHGSLGEITSWLATDLYSCGGQWMRIGPRIENCECNQKIFNNFIFV